MRSILLALSVLSLAACDSGGPLAPDRGRHPAPRPAPLAARRPSPALDSLIVVLPVEPIVDVPEPYEP